ncbi:hypothetical protein [Streptomyces sp. NPDC093707]|uniref:hypothetical protein n=1 Tax=Streptomyces sp. NPDC093707 TaxID=3154984 RepID=UPI00344B9286
MQPKRAHAGMGGEGRNRRTTHLRAPSPTRPDGKGNKMPKWKCTQEGPHKGKVVNVTPDNPPPSPTSVKWEAKGETDTTIRAWLEVKYDSKNAAMVIENIDAKPEGIGLGSLLVYLFAETAKSWNIKTIRVDLAALTPGAVGLYRNIKLQPDKNSLKKITDSDPWKTDKIGPNFASAVWQRKGMDSLLWDLGGGRTPMNRALDDGYKGFDTGGTETLEKKAVISVRKVTEDTGLHNSLTHRDWIDPKNPMEDKVKRLAWAYKAAIMTVPLQGTVSDALNASKQALSGRWEQVKAPVAA